MTTAGNDALVLVVVRCRNPFCPEALRGKARIIGEVSAGAHWRIKCPKCRGYSEGVA